MLVRGSSRSDRVQGFLSLKSSLALCCALLVVLALADRLCRFRSDNRLDTRGWKVTDFLEHLQRSGVQLHVVPADKHGVLSGGAYLTEDPDPTWAAMQRRMRVVEDIHHWHGTVWVGRANDCTDAELFLAQSGEFGCQIGDFLFFGDTRVLRRIQEACGELNGR